MKTKVQPLVAFVRATLARFGVIEADIAQLEIDVAAAGKVDTVNDVLPDAEKNVSLTTTEIPEGTNLYLTNTRVQATPLTGLTANNADLVATDTLVPAFGKVLGRLNTLKKDLASGVAGLTATFGINLKNVAGTVTSSLTTVATATRAWTFPDKSGTVAMLDDIPAAGGGGAWVYIGQITAAGSASVMQDLNIIPDGYEAVRIIFKGNLLGSGYTVSFRAVFGGVVASDTRYFAKAYFSSAAPGLGDSFGFLQGSNTGLSCYADYILAGLDASAGTSLALYHGVSSLADGAGAAQVNGTLGHLQKSTGFARITGIQIYVNNASIYFTTGSVLKIYGLKKV